MATCEEKQRITSLLQQETLRLCTQVVPYSSSLELHGVLLLEVDGQDFCTLTFKNAKTIEQQDNRLIFGKASLVDTSPDVGKTYSQAEDIFVVAQSQEGGSGFGYDHDTQQAVRSVADDVTHVTRVRKPRESTQKPNHSSKRSSQNQSRKNTDSCDWEKMPWKQQKNRNGKFECPICRREFSHATNLTRHQRTRHGRPQLRTAHKEPKQTTEESEHIHVHASLDMECSSSSEAENVISKNDSGSLDDREVENCSEKTGSVEDFDNNNVDISSSRNGSTGYSTTTCEPAIVTAVVSAGETTQVSEHCVLDVSDAHSMEDTEPRGTEVITDLNGQYLKGHTVSVTLELQPTNTYITAHNQAIVSQSIRTPLHVQPPTYKHGSFISPNTDGPIDVSFSPSAMEGSISDSLNSSGLHMMKGSVLDSYSPSESQAHFTPVHSSFSATPMIQADNRKSITPPGIALNANNATHARFQERPYSSFGQRSDNKRLNSEVVQDGRRNHASSQSLPHADPGSASTERHVRGEQSHMQATETNSDFSPLSTKTYTASSGKEYVDVADTTLAQTEHARPPKYRCPKCGREFEFYQNLGRHAKVSHQMSIIELEKEAGDGTNLITSSLRNSSSGNAHVCDICHHSFKHISNLYRHKTKLHGYKGKKNQSKTVDKESAPKHKPKEIGAKSEVKKPKTSKHKCDLCAMTFAFSSSLSRHMRRAHKMVRVGLYSKDPTRATSDVTTCPPVGIGALSVLPLSSGGPSSTPVDSEAGHNLHSTDLQRSKLSECVRVSGITPHADSSLRVQTTASKPEHAKRKKPCGDMPAKPKVTSRPKPRRERPSKSCESSAKIRSASSNTPSHSTPKTHHRPGKTKDYEQTKCTATARPLAEKQHQSQTLPSRDNVNTNQPSEMSLNSYTSLASKAHLGFVNAQRTSAKDHRLITTAAVTVPDHLASTGGLGTGHAYTAPITLQTVNHSGSYIPVPRTELTVPSPILDISHSPDNWTPPKSKKKRRSTDSKRSPQEEPSSGEKRRTSGGQSSTGHRDHRCGICSKQFTHRTNYTRHMKNIHGTVPD